MTKKIKTYEDLLAEELRLTAQLGSYKQLIKTDIAGVKAGLNPIKKAKEKVKSLFTREDKNSPAINFALNFVLDFIIRKIIPKRTGVFTKTIIPFFIKNYVSHLITDEQRKSIATNVNGFIGKVQDMIRKAAQKKQERAYARASAAANHYEA
ncbi:MAG TPA: hypothetical protein VF609_15535 [Flavisolibacter sp.]|jgi:hypothetical protein